MDRDQAIAELERRRQRALDEYEDEASEYAKGFTRGAAHGYTMALKFLKSTSAGLDAITGKVD